MNRESALSITIIFFFIFLAIAFYGCQLKLLSAIVISVFISLILLNIFYPPHRITQDPNDFTLIIYSIIEILGLLLIFFYIAFITLSDVRVC